MAEYIDKQRVIDIINTTCPDFNIPEINDSWAHKLTVIIREALFELVKQAPAADVRENVKGEWIKSQRDEDFVVCSNCKNIGYRTAAWRTDYAERIKFCPNCGADMRKTCDDQERLNNERLDR